ncbi:hypothetical protein GYMLUDRAFT_395552 [Collybiopsis luxurians FD-317 M1]|uniref:Uncharacterized protein n=1 Tax=Collybiopsis luxurians FD-317 M1 TaxID=944289 RepID=A0A0D0BAU6_9AGAR|nr:hypothetical protein GYMLUDRAFT_395552 [Collybiopsis luxurians FD-317 M1]
MISGTQLSQLRYGSIEFMQLSFRVCKRLKNLQLFFNIGPGGYPLYTLLFPFRVLPYTDGRSWARREGLLRHRGIRMGEELTDEEDEP